MARLPAAQTLVKTISLLGGPLLEPTDIDWATDLPAGNFLFEWLVDQFHPSFEQNVTSGDNAIDDNEETLETRICAAVREVALEKDEVLILNHSKRDASDPISDSDCMPLSRLKQQAGYINNETELLKRETDLLSARLALLKKASQKLTQAIKSLQRTLDEVKSNIYSAEERLSELSVNADTTIAAALANAKKLIHSLNISDPDDNANTTIIIEGSDLVHDKDIVDRQARSSLVRAQTSLIAIVADLREHTERLSLIRKEEVLRNQDIHTEANRLKAAFKPIKSGSANPILTMDPELEDICALLEREASSRERGLVPTELEDFLQELDELDDNSEVSLEPLGVDVDAELYRAYCLDQIAVLQTYESGLDQSSTSLDIVLAPLERLHTSLAKVWHCVQETEALLQVFEDELDNLDPDLVNKRLDTKIDSHGEDNDPSNPSSSASLHENILTEYLERKRRLATMETSEKVWIEALIREYSARPIHPSLPHIYANSPVTTSTPFSFPPQIREIEVEARDRSMRLESLVKRLEIEVHETFTNNGPTAKRLDTFVERWCGSVPK